MLSLRGMESGDLPLVTRWLSAPHVAKWFLAGSSVQREVEDLRRSISGEQDVHALMVGDGDMPIGWCQWYRCAVDPLWAAEIGAALEDVGIDYAIGSSDHIGRGVGSELVGALINRVRAVYPGCAFTADPDAAEPQVTEGAREERVRARRGDQSPLRASARSGGHLPPT